MEDATGWRARHFSRPSENDTAQSSMDEQLPGKGKGDLSAFLVSEGLSLLMETADNCYALPNPVLALARCLRV
jgi:hypothetical protein